MAALRSSSLDDESPEGLERSFRDADPVSVSGRSCFGNVTVPVCCISSLAFERSSKNVIPPSTRLTVPAWTTAKTQALTQAQKPPPAALSSPDELSGGEVSSVEAPSLADDWDWSVEAASLSPRALMLKYNAATPATVRSRIPSAPLHSAMVQITDSSTLAPFPLAACDKG